MSGCLFLEDRKVISVLLIAIGLSYSIKLGSLVIFLFSCFKLRFPGFPGVISSHHQVKNVMLSKVCAYYFIFLSFDKDNSEEQIKKEHQ